MAATLEQLQDLENAIALGALTVRDRVGRTITYRNLEEMRSIRDDLRRELGLDAGSSSSSGRRRVWTHNRGT